MYASPTPNFVHTFTHDLESLIYVLVWICVYQAPKEVCNDQNINQTCLKQWALAKTLNNIGNLCDLKLRQPLLRAVLSDLTPYFMQMKSIISKLYRLYSQLLSSQQQSNPPACGC